MGLLQMYCIKLKDVSFYLFIYFLDKMWNLLQSCCLWLLKFNLGGTNEPATECLLFYPALGLTLQ